MMASFTAEASIYSSTSVYSAGHRSSLPSVRGQMRPRVVVQLQLRSGALLNWSRECRLGCVRTSFWCTDQCGPANFGCREACLNSLSGCFDDCRWLDTILDGVFLN
jgi:hypothetical protein